MCNCDECRGAEYCEAHDKEYEEMQKALAEATEKDGVEELTQEEIDAGLKKFDEIDLEKEAAETPSNVKTRLFDEIMDLGEKIDKLGRYLNGRNEDGVRHIIADRLTDAQVYLLHKQYDTMNEYYNILCSRYSIFDLKKPINAKGLTSAVEIVTE